MVPSLSRAIERATNLNIICRYLNLEEKKWEDNFIANRKTKVKVVTTLTDYGKKEMLFSLNASKGNNSYKMC